MSAEMVRWFDWWFHADIDEQLQTDLDEAVTWWLAVHPS